jgi:aspartate-semialdehyde dehydrogenase
MQQRLCNHPWFELKAVGGRQENAGRLLEQIPWRLDQLRPNLPSVPIFDLSSDSFIQDMLQLGIEVAFSCLPSDVAERVETELARAGIAVFSNASFHRGKDGIPLVIPEINAEHSSAFSTNKGPIMCGTNCTLIPLAVPLAALRTFQIQTVRMRSEQALSGAGWQLLFDEDANKGILDSEIPGEAEKVAEELLHVFGTLDGTTVVPAQMELDIECQRVVRRDGHQVFVKATFAQPLSLEFVLQAFTSHQFPKAMMQCPSAPTHPLHIVEHIDVEQHLWSNGTAFTNQPRPSEDLQTGMAIIVGDVKLIDEYTVSFSAYSHNTIRGAAGGTMLLAEQAVVEGHIP